MTRDVHLPQCETNQHWKRREGKFVLKKRLQKLLLWKGSGSHAIILLPCHYIVTRRHSCLLPHSNLPLTVYGFPTQQTILSARVRGRNWGEMQWEPSSQMFNPLNPELNPICYLLALLGARHFLHVSRIRVKLLTFRRLMSYIYGAPIPDVSRSHTTTQHSR